MWRGGTPRFNRLELQILGAVTAELDSNAAERLRRRIAQVNLVQRHDGGREVNCYQIERGVPVFDESTRLAETEGESLFAEISFSTAGGMPMTMTTQMWLVNGFFFSLEFDNATEHCAEGSVNSLSVRLIKDESSRRSVPSGGR
jgi:hypothetical protein